MVPSCMRGLPLFQMVSLLAFWQILLGKDQHTYNQLRKVKIEPIGNIYMKIYVFIGKTTHLSNLKPLYGQKHHFTYHFLCKINVYLQALNLLPLTVLPPKCT